MATPTRQLRARGQARHDALIRAAVSVAAERGAAGITHRAVTEKAGVPLATASYFFDSIEALTEEALRTLAAEHVATMTELAESLATVDSTPDEVATIFANAIALDAEQVLAQMEAYLSAARSPRMREAVRDVLAAYRNVAAAGARAAGAPDPEALAGVVVALLDGMTLHNVADPRPDWRERVAAAIRTLFLGHLVEHGQAKQAAKLIAG